MAAVSSDNDRGMPCETSEILRVVVFSLIVFPKFKGIADMIKRLKANLESQKKRCLERAKI